MGQHRTLGVTAVATAAVLAAQGACPAATAAPPVSPRHGAAAAAVAPAAPADHSVDDLLQQLRTRYRQAQRATERYESTQRKLTAQRAKVKRLDAQLAAATVRVHGGREEAGRLARSQYRGTVPGMPPLLVLLLSGHPRAALVQDHALTHAVSTQTAAVKRLTAAERRRDALAGKARKALRRRQRLTDRREQRRDEMRQRLRGVEELLMELSPAQRSALPAADEAGPAQAGVTDWR
jgi:peptidoglycan DL-endopeptidase CwlO